MPQCFPLFVIDYPFNYGDFLYFDKICSKSSAAELAYEGKIYTGTPVYSFIEFSTCLLRYFQSPLLQIWCMWEQIFFRTLSFAKIWLTSRKLEEYGICKFVRLSIWKQQQTSRRLSKQAHIANGCRNEFVFQPFLLANFLIKVRIIFLLQQKYIQVITIFWHVKIY